MFSQQFTIESESSEAIFIKFQQTHVQPHDLFAFLHNELLGRVFVTNHVLQLLVEFGKAVLVVIDPCWMVKDQVQDFEDLNACSAGVFGFELPEAAVDKQVEIIVCEELAFSLLICHQDTDCLKGLVEAVHRATNREVKQLLFVDLLSLEELFDYQVILRLILLVMWQENCEDGDERVLSALIDHVLHRVNQLLGERLTGSGHALVIEDVD